MFRNLDNQRELLPEKFSFRLRVKGFSVTAAASSLRSGFGLRQEAAPSIFWGSLFADQNAARLGHLLFNNF
jgi:hypothetical protein